MRKVNIDNYCILGVRVKNITKDKQENIDSAIEFCKFINSNKDNTNVCLVEPLKNSEYSRFFVEIPSSDNDHLVSIPILFETTENGYTEVLSGENVNYNMYASSKKIPSIYSAGRVNVEAVAELIKYLDEEQIEIFSESIHKLSVLIRDYALKNGYRRPRSRYNEVNNDTLDALSLVEEYKYVRDRKRTNKY